MNDTRRATLRDVAARAGVGKSTASNALTGSGRMSESTRTAVLTAASELGYVPNRSARNLRSRTTRSIGVYIPETPSRSEYYMQFVFGVLDRAAVRDVDVTVVTNRSGSARSAPHVDGLIISDPVPDDTFGRTLLDSPVVSVTNERATDGPMPDGTVRADHGSALTELLDHLAESGARRPALVVPEATTDWAIALSDAYREWTARHGCPAAIRRIGWVPTVSEIHAAVDSLHDADPDLDALICGPVDTAPMALAPLRARGIRVGEDVLLACGTDSTTLAVTDPPITAIDQQPRVAGERCADMLFALLDGSDTETDVEVPTRLIKRRSTLRD